MTFKRLLMTGLVLAMFSPLQPADSAEKPSVLFIAVDDLNDWIGCMQGHPQAQTPHIDRLAERGVVFTNAHCAAPACNPSRAAVFSGLMPNVTGVWSNQTGRIQALRPDTQYLPMAFARAGYKTLGTGKLLHSSSKIMFDEYFSVEQRWSPLTKQSVAYTDRELPTKGTDNPRHVVKDSRGQEIVLPLNSELYDLRKDPREWHNLADSIEHADVLKILRNHLSTIRK